MFATETAAWMNMWLWYLPQVDCSWEGWFDRTMQSNVIPYITGV